MGVYFGMGEFGTTSLSKQLWSRKKMKTFEKKTTDSTKKSQVRNERKQQKSDFAADNGRTSGKGSRTSRGQSFILHYIFKLRGQAKKRPSPRTTGGQLDQCFLEVTSIQAFFRQTFPWNISVYSLKFGRVFSPCKTFENNKFFSNLDMSPELTRLKLFFSPWGQNASRKSICFGSL